MGSRPSSELLRSLRVTLQKLEESFALPEDEPNVTELKRILLLRIADIEVIDALQEVPGSEASPEPNDPVSEAQLSEFVVEQSPGP